jgi:hypothetical protein
MLLIVQLFNVFRHFGDGEDNSIPESHLPLSRSEASEEVTNLQSNPSVGGEDGRDALSDLIIENDIPDSTDWDS